jgi:hypothetical protein
MSADARGALEHLWHTGGGDPAALERAPLAGADPLLATGFTIGAATSAAVASTPLAAAEVWGLTPPFWARPSVPLGAHEPAWPA